MRHKQDHGFGIYKIYSKIKLERLYVGSARDFGNRFERHRYELRKNVHHSIKLQRHYNKYGLDDLVFEIIERHDVLDRELLKTREKYYMDLLNPYFNSIKEAFSCAGYKHTKEACEKMSIAQRYIWDNKVMTEEEHRNRSNGQRGIKRRLGQHNTSEQNKKIGDANRGKISRKTIEASIKANTGRKHSIEEIEKRRIGLLKSWKTRDKEPLRIRTRDEKGHWVKTRK
jgi:group I intron endonuclease